MVDFYPTISIATLNMNNLNTLVKRPMFLNWTEKKNHNQKPKMKKTD